SKRRTRFSFLRFINYAVLSVAGSLADIRGQRRRVFRDQRTVYWKRIHSTSQIHGASLQPRNRRHPHSETIQRIDSIPSVKDCPRFGADSWSREGSMRDPMTIQQAARTALECQYACNLSGVLASFKEIVHEVIWPEARRLGKG